jgi:hypothetical protein
VFGEEVEGGDGSHHFCETGYLSHLVDTFAVVVHVFGILSFPYAPTLGGYLRYALLVGEEVQKVTKILHAVRTVPAGASLGLH